MAVKKTAVENTAETTEEVKTETVVKEATYTVEKLRQNSIQLFGVSKSTFDGAMYDHPNDEEYTVSRVNSIIKKWLFGEGGNE